MLSLYNQSCYGLQQIEDNSVHAVVTDPPYGISLERWDKMPSKAIWSDCYRVLKPGGFLICFSSIQFLHLFTKDILDAGFVFKDTLNWVFLNGRVPPINVDSIIDNHLGEIRPESGVYKYTQGVPNSKKKDSYKQEKVKTSASDISKKWEGFGLGLKTAYEPILLVQKPFDKLASNILENDVGALNINATRIPYNPEETKVGHNPHPLGRVMANIIQTESFGDYQKFFLVGKVRDGKKTGNHHPTVKPTDLMECLIELITLENQIVLDPFMGSGSTGVACKKLNRSFIGYEKDLENGYFKIAEDRINSTQPNTKL